MAVDLRGARAAAASYLLGDSCVFLRPRLIDDCAGGTAPDPAGPRRIGPFPCAFSAMNGREVLESDQVQPRGTYKLKLATSLTDPSSGDAFMPDETDQVELLGDTYAIVWTPPVAAFSLFRVLGLDNTP